MGTFLVGFLVSQNGMWYLRTGTHTAKNTVISPNFLVWKVCGKAQFAHSLLGETRWNYGIFRSVIQRRTWDPVKHLRWCNSAKLVNSYKLWAYFTETLHHVWQGTNYDSAINLCVQKCFKSEVLQIIRSAFKTLVFMKLVYPTSINFYCF